MPSSSVSSTPDHGRPGWRERAAGLAIYVLVAVLATWPLAWRPRTLLGAPQGEGDPYLNLFTLGWDLRQLFLAPSSWLTGAVFDAPIFHPARQTLAFTDHLLLQALLVSPILRDLARPRPLLQRRLHRVAGGERLGDVVVPAAVARRPPRSGRRWSRVGFLRIPLLARVAPATAGAVLPAAGVRRPAPRRRAPTVAGRGVARPLVRTDRRQRGLLRRDSAWWRWVSAGSHSWRVLAACHLGACLRPSPSAACCRRRWWRPCSCRMSRRSNARASCGRWTKRAGMRRPSPVS